MRVTLKIQYEAYESKAECSSTANDMLNAFLNNDKASALSLSISPVFPHQAQLPRDPHDPDLVPTYNKNGKRIY